MAGALEIFREGVCEKIFQLLDDNITIGRDFSNNQICLMSEDVSRRHAKIVRRKNKYYFHDTSTNGSYVDEEHVHQNQKEIKHGSIIKIGIYQLFLNELGVSYDPSSTETFRKINAETVKQKPTLFQLEFENTETKKTEKIAIDRDYFSVGSDSKNQFIISDEGEDGPVHFSIKIIDDKAFLQSYKSKTFINGQKAAGTPIFLNQGDKICIGKYIFEFIDQNAKKETTYKYHIVTKSKKMMEMICQVENTAKFDKQFVLITGETGTGKELVAKAVHEVSARAEKRFVSVNCASIKKDLAESLLFGFVKGSFTNAIDDRIGLFEQAEGGTLFLDEIGELGPEIQGSLLRAIEDKDISPIGSVKSKKIDVRIIAATNRKLEDKACRDLIQFREDFYFRLGGIKIPLPPLRERKEDIPLLMDHFLLLAKAENPHMKSFSFSKEAYEEAAQYRWLGNVRVITLFDGHVIDLFDGACAA
ncbi:MAG: sigma 54-interacting transcriptional regulator [bacterium]